MNIRSLKFAVVLTLSILGMTASPILSHAANSDGGIYGGGGKGVLCKQPDGSSTVELLDLWEARNFYHRQLISPTGTAAQITDAAFARLKNVAMLAHQDGKEFNITERPLSDYIRDNAKALMNPEATNVNRIYKGRLALTPDSFEQLTPDMVDGCEIVQLVIYNNYGYQHANVQMNQVLVDKMDELNRSALGLHESVYAELREHYGEPNSLRVRRAIGFVYSGGQFESLPSLLSSPHVVCQSLDKETKFYMTLNNGLVGLLVERIAGVSILGFSKPMAGFGPSLEYAMKEIGKDAGTVLNPSGSMTDYDTEYRYDSRHPSIELNFLAGQPVLPAKKANVKCRIEK